jgi:hypothetical protein
MKVTSIQKDGIVRTITYINKDYFYEDGTRVPDTARKGFNTTIFRMPPNPRRPIVQSELDDWIKETHERLGKNRSKKPEPTQQPESSND